MTRNHLNIRASSVMAHLSTASFYEYISHHCSHVLLLQLLLLLVVPYIAHCSCKSRVSQRGQDEVSPYKHNGTFDKFFQEHCQESNQSAILNAIMEENRRLTCQLLDKLPFLYNETSKYCRDMNTILWVRQSLSLIAVSSW